MMERNVDTDSDICMRDGLGDRESGLKGLKEILRGESCALTRAYRENLEGVIGILDSEPIISRIDAKRAVIIGDTHGDIETFCRVLERYPIAEYTYVMMGDYVDRGSRSTELLALLLMNKMRYPHNIFMIRGDHESPIGSIYPQQFPDEFLGKLNDRQTLYGLYNELFPKMPIAAVLNNRYFIVHGGISIGGYDIGELSDMKKVRDPESNDIILQMLWNDPSRNRNNEYSSRGDGIYKFGYDIADDFLRRNDLNMIIRGHEHRSGGYDLNNGNIMTILTTRAYRGDGQYIVRIDGERFDVIDVGMRDCTEDKKPEI